LKFASLFLDAQALSRRQTDACNRVRFVVGGVDLVRAGHHIEAGHHKLIAPHNRLARLIETSLGAVAVAAAGQDLDLATRPNHAYGILGEIGHVDISGVVHANTVGRSHALVFGIYAVRCDVVLRIECNLVYRAVAEVADVQIALLVENQPIEAVLATHVEGPKFDQQILIVAGIIDLNVFIPGKSLVDEVAPEIFDPRFIFADKF